MISLSIWWEPYSIYWNIFPLILVFHSSFDYCGRQIPYFHILEKTLILGKIEGRRRRDEDEMVGWHYWLDGHEFEQAPGVSDGQGSLACCSPWGRKESDMTEQWNWTDGGNKTHFLFSKFDFTFHLTFSFVSNSKASTFFNSEWI